MGQREFWDEYIVRYAGRHGLTTNDSRRVTGRFARRTVSTLLRHQTLAELKRMTVLEFGCGTGRLARFIAPLCHRLICCDISEAMLEIARKELSSHCNVVYLQTDGGPLPRVDFAYSYAALSYEPSEQSLWSAAARLDAAATAFCLHFHKVANEHPDPTKSVDRISRGDAYAVEAYRPSVKTLRLRFRGPVYWVERHRPDVRGREPFLYKGQRLSRMRRLADRIVTCR
jgi:SAM-dependent methyltransferase